MARTKIKTADITASAVTATEIAPDAVGASELANDAVASANIIDGAIVNADINASAAIATSKITGLATSATTDTTNADNISSGTLGSARMGSGTASATTVLYGDGTWKAEPVTDVAGLKNDIALLAFKTQANGSLAKYKLVDQTVDAFEDNSGVDLSASTNELFGAPKYMSGGGDATQGGTYSSFIDSGVTYGVRQFLEDGDFIAYEPGTLNKVLMVGGGGGGGKPAQWSIGGGGAGGVLYRTSYAIPAATYPIVIGQGGVASTTQATQGDGTDTTAFSVGAGTAGGRGGQPPAPGPGRAGANGGGSHASAAGGVGTAPTASGWTVYGGYNGGIGTSPGAHGGGGGAGCQQAGQAGNIAYGGDGGDGIQIAIANTNFWWGGGGGGEASNYYQQGPTGSGGKGGGAGGGSGSGSTGGTWSNTYGTADLNGRVAGTDAGVEKGGNAGVGTGGGGGAASFMETTGQGDVYYGRGGSGIVIIEYDVSSFTVYQDMTLVSTATTAEAQPTKADLVMTYSNGAGTATIGTDITAEVSRDNGTTYTSFGIVPASDQGTTGGHTIVTSHDLDISGQPAGTSMRYRIKTINQSVALWTQIQAVSLGWS